jgi:hypothetical protein
VAFAMTKKLTEQAADPGLDSLLQIEQRLRERVQEAQAQARARLDAARAEVQASSEREAGLFEEQERAREQADRQWRRERHSKLLAEHAAAMRRLAEVPSQRIEALALTALAHAIEPARSGSR